MTNIPERPTAFHARTTADFHEVFQRFSDTAGLTPLDLSGWAFSFRVKAAVTDAEALLEATIANGKIEVTDAAQGELAVRFDKTELAALITGASTGLDGVYELQAAGPAGEDEVWAAGPFHLARGV